MIFSSKVFIRRFEANTIPLITARINRELSIMASADSARKYTFPTVDM